MWSVTTEDAFIPARVVSYRIEMSPGMLCISVRFPEFTSTLVRCDSVPACDASSFANLRFCCNALPTRYKPSKTLTHGCPISQGWLINPAPKLQLVLYPRTSEVCKKFEKLEASQLGEKPLHGLPRCGSEDIDELESDLAAADTLQELGAIMQAMLPTMCDQYRSIIDILSRPALSHPPTPFPVVPPLLPPLPPPPKPILGPNGDT